MTDVVLREKLRIPEMTGLARPRLERRLGKDSGAALEVVIAPAGSGKTTLLSRLAAVADVPVAWYRVTADDAAERLFVAHISGALANFVELPGFSHVEEMRDLLALLDNWTSTSAILILDDLHEIAETPAEKALERFISLRPRALRLICGSRRMPDINVPRLRVSGSYDEITSDDLRFRSWEVEELFASVYREPLRPEAAAALTRRTGGWAAGLQLFHLATAGRSSAERHQAVADLGGRSKLVRSYLTRNVLAELAVDRREFLLQTCTLGRLSGEACDLLLGTLGSHRVLEQLEAAQLFTFTDDENQHYRYHEVLQSHLELALVEEYGPTAAEALYSKSARILERLGELRAATRAYAKAGDWVSVSRLLQDTGLSRIDASVSDDALLLSAGTWRQDPWLALATARRLVREGALERGFEAYRHAQSLYDEANYQQICRTEAHVVAMWLAGRPAAGAAHSRVKHWSRPLRDAVRGAADFRAVPAPGPNEDVRKHLVYGLAAFAAGEIGRARAVLSAIPSEKSCDALATIAATLAVAAMDILVGADVDPAIHLSTIASSAEHEGLPWVSRLCHGVGQLALLASNRADWRFDSCSDMVRAADAMGDAWGAALLSFAVGVAQQRAGDTGDAHFRDAADRFRTLDAPVLELWCQLWALRGDATPTELSDAVERGRRLGVQTAVSWALSLAAAPTRSSAPAVDPKIVVRQPPRVAIVCFGGYRLMIDGRVADLAQLRPQARAVLQILSLSPDRDFHREHLEDILWPGVAHAVAGHRLQVAVSSARTLLDSTGFDSHGMGIQRRSHSYRLCLPEGATVDVRAFEDALTEAGARSARGDVAGRITSRQRALELYSGDLLPENTASSYIETERDRLRRSAAAAASALSADLRALGDQENALSAAQRSVHLDPYQEIPWVILADLYDRVGDRSSAEYVRREHGRVRAELGVSGVLR